MKLKKITLDSIFSFYKKEVIEFDKINIIVAKNGFGKTSILNAIKLCLGYSNIEYNSILNNNSKINKCSVELEFNEFTIKREWNIEDQSESVKVIFSSDEYLVDIEAENYIQEKIPSFLVNLLFYDGEIDSNILLLSNAKIKKLFEYIFDLDLLQNMSKDCIKASRDLLISNEEKTISKEYNTLKEQIIKDEQYLLLLKEEKILKEEKYKNIKLEVDKLDKKLRQKNKKLDSLKQKLDSLNIKLEDKLAIFKQLILFEMPLILNKQLRHKVLTEELPAIEVKSLKQLKNKINIFSQKLNLDSNYIEELFQSVFLNNTKIITLSYDTKTFKSILLDIKNIQNEKDILELKIKQIQNNELENDEFKLILQNIDSQKQELTILAEEIDDIENSVYELVQTIKENEKILTKLYKSQKDSFASIHSYETLLSIENIAKEIYKKEIIEKISIFNKSLYKNTREFISVYSHIKSILINNDLSIDIFDTNNQKLNNTLLSAGQKQVLNFLIIKTILEFKNFSDFIIVDTPLGRLSNMNKDLILNNCYLKFNQLALLVTDSEFEYLQDKNLKFKQYKINKNNVGSYIKEVK